MKRIIVFLFLVLSMKSVCAEQKKMDKIPYGVAYYHEYMPYERLDKDIQMMKDAGIVIFKGTDLFTNKALKKDDSFVLKPWDL